MEAVRTPETSANFYQTTRRDMPEDSFHNRRRENLKSHIFNAANRPIIKLSRLIRGSSIGGMPQSF
jgi:hypothetical protein